MRPSLYDICYGNSITYFKFDLNESFYLQQLVSQQSIMLLGFPNALADNKNVLISQNHQTFQSDLPNLSQQKQLEITPYTISFPSFKQSHSECLSQTTSVSEQKEEVRLPDKKGKNLWKREEQLEFFYATIQFSFKYPYHTLSWECWKPDRFFNELQEHMKNIFGIHGKLIRHIKAKDQYYKNMANKKDTKPLDLLDFCLQRLNAFVRGERKKGRPLSNLQIDRLQRFEKMIRNYKECSGQAHKPKQYDIQLQKLMNYSLSVEQTIQNLYKFNKPF